jgi:DNA-binding transcriptional MerR regulator
MMRISVVARRAGLHSSAIRYYEAHGLLRSRRLPSGYRVYDEEAIAALRFLRRAQGFGIALKEIKELLDLSSRGPDRAHASANSHDTICRKSN